jgi:hypothetical protein
MGFTATGLAVTFNTIVAFYRPGFFVMGGLFLVAGVFIIRYGYR